MLGARAHDFGRGDAAFLARAAALAGVSCLQLAPAKALVDCPPPPGPMDAAWARSAAASLAARGIGVAVLGCYVELCSADAAARRSAIDRLSHNLRLAPSFGAACVATETPMGGGSREEGLGFLREALGELLPEAERIGVPLCIEPVWGHAVSSPRAMARLLKEFPSPMLGAILDPVNLVDPLSGEESWFRALEALELFGDRVRALHVKDYVVEGRAKVDAVPGSGLMDWKSVARAAVSVSPNLPFIAEAQDGPGRAAAFAILRSALG